MDWEGDNLLNYMLRLWVHPSRPITPLPSCQHSILEKVGDEAGKQGVQEGEGAEVSKSGSKMSQLCNLRL